MSQANCPICGEPDLKYLYSAQDRLLNGEKKYGVLFCSNCPAGISDITVSDNYFQEAYPVEYYTKIIRADNTCDVSNQMSLLDSHGDVKGKKVLELGCAGGDLLYSLSDKGAKVFGVEPSGYARNIALGRGIKVFRGIEEIKEKDFDLIILFDVLEHIANPLHIMQTIYELLSPSGLVVLSAPNFASLEAKVLKKRWFALELPRHLFHFTPSAVKVLAERSHLRLKSVKYVMTSFFLKSFFDERLKTKPRFYTFKSKVLRPLELLSYYVGNRPYMVVYLEK